MITFFIISALAIASATPIQKGESLPGGGCLEYTVDRCDFGQPDSSTNDEPVEFCSLVCNSQPECKFFNYDYKKSQCNHYYTQQNEDFKSYCEEYAGPKGTNGSLPISQCTTSTSDPCKGITRSSCQYSGEIIKTYPDVTEEMCQQFCQFLPDCLAYTFGKTSEECQLRTSDDKTCDQVIVESGVTSEDVDRCKAGCPSDWTQAGEKCYLTSPTKMNWQQAQEFCTDKGGWLAETFASEEQSIMDQVLDKSLAYWIGLTDSAVEGKFVWQHSSKPLSWSNWNPGEPNNLGEEDCVMLVNELRNSGGIKWKWDDYVCSHNVCTYGCGDIHALCEYSH